jgi:hypothetical protein
MGTSVAEGLRSQLQVASIGVADALEGWSIHIGKAPASPDTCIVITRTPGRSPDPKWLVDYPAYQIRVRGPKGHYDLGEQKAQEIKDYFLGFGSADIDGARWVSITMPSDFSYIGNDDNDRPNFSLNLQMIIEPPQTLTNTNREPI